MTQTDKVLARKEAGVGIVTFNNPERRNAMSVEMWEATTSVLAGFAADSEVRVVVLTGAGGKAFVSGADISQFADPARLARCRPRLRRQDRGRLRQHLRVSQADDRDDPRLLRWRRSCARGLLRPADLLGQFEVCRAGGEARPRLRPHRAPSG